jgi:sugar/nucleoside kinase (ribokinase family)
MSEDPSPRAGVLCAGTILVDVAKVIDGYPALDHLTTIERIWLSTGGPALNMAVDLSMLGAPFPLGVLGAVGDDAHAAFILAECARLGINTDGVATLPGAATSFTDVMVEKDGGRRTMFHHPGANALFDASTAGLETSTARILHTGAPGIHPVMDSRRPGGGNGWSALLQRAQAAGLHTNMELVSISPDRTAATALPCLPHLDSIVINELEAAHGRRAGGLAGARGDGRRPDRARRLRARGGALPGRLRRGRSRRPDLAARLRPAAPRPGPQHHRRRRRLRRRRHPGPAPGLAGRTLPAARGRLGRGVRTQPAHLRRHHARAGLPGRSRPSWLPPGREPVTAGSGPGPAGWTAP